MENKLKIAPPWITYYNEIEAMFGEDPEIKIEYNEDENVINMYVNGQEKADALTKLLPAEKNFGGVSIYTKVIPANKEDALVDTFYKAFKGNPVFSFVKSVDGFMIPHVDYVVFARKIATFYDDNWQDVYGNRNFLYEDVARDIFEEAGNDGVWFCTDRE